MKNLGMALFSRKITTLLDFDVVEWFRKQVKIPKA